MARMAFDAFPEPAYLLEVRGGTHFSFNNRSSGTAASRLLSGTEEQFDVIRRYAIAFLEKHVAWRDDGGVLGKEDPRLSQVLRK